MTVLDPDRTEVRYNGEWLGKLDYAEIVRLARTITVARILERDDFAKRFAANEPISVSELLYPLSRATTRSRSRPTSSSADRPALQPAGRPGRDAGTTASSRRR